MRSRRRSGCRTSCGACSPRARSPRPSCRSWPSTATRRGDEATRDLVGKVGALLAARAPRASRWSASLAAPWLVYALAGGFARTPGKVELTATLIRIVFPYILFISLVSLAGGVLNVLSALRDSRVHAGAAERVDHRRGDLARAASSIRRSSRSRGASRSAASRSCCCRSWPLARLRHAAAPRRSTCATRACGACSRRWDRPCIGVSAAQISVLISTQLAALLGDGRISWITYADRLMEFPDRAARRRARHGHPAVARPASQRTRTMPSTRALLDWGLRLALLLALPAARGAVAARACRSSRRSTSTAISRVNDVWQTRAALLGYAVGLPALILIKILAPGFYARQDMRTPVQDRVRHGGRDAGLRGVARMAARIRVTRA